MSNVSIHNFAFLCLILTHLSWTVSFSSMVLKLWFLGVFPAHFRFGPHSQAEESHHHRWLMIESHRAHSTRGAGSYL
jgi:hypothetical protein